MSMTPQRALNKAVAWALCQLNARGVVSQAGVITGRWKRSGAPLGAGQLTGDLPEPLALGLIPGSV